MIKQGLFITFEGPEGCGKSTHAKALKGYLEDQGHRVLLTHEPGGTQLGQNIREWLLDPKNNISKTSEIYLFGADRAEHVSQVILPALKKGKIVICDRYTDSTIAYQVGGRGLPEDLVRYVNMTSSQGLIPDLTLLLDVSSEEGLKRAGQVGAADRFEREKISFHKKVRAGYLTLAKNDPDRIRVVSTEDMKIITVQSAIRKIVNEKF
ncbi:MAG: dTMP kinase [bacterium]